MSNDNLYLTTYMNIYQPHDHPVTSDVIIIIIIKNECLSNIIVDRLQSCNVINTVADDVILASVAKL